MLKRYLSPTHRDDTVEGCPLPALIGEVATTAPMHAEVLADQLEQSAAQLEDQLGATGALSRRHLALGLLALMYGGLGMARSVRGTPLSDEILRACRALGRVALRHTTQETP